MKEKIISQMESILEATPNIVPVYPNNPCHASHQLSAVESPEFKFPALWVVDVDGSRLLQIARYKEAFFGDERVRFDYMKEGNPFQWVINHECASLTAKLYLITEDGVTRISESQGVAMADERVRDAVREWENANGYLVSPGKIPVHFDGVTVDEIKTLIYDMRKAGGGMLLDCLKKCRNIRRESWDQHIKIRLNRDYNELEVWSCIGSVSAPDDEFMPAYIRYRAYDGSWKYEWVENMDGVSYRACY